MASTSYDISTSSGAEKGEMSSIPYNSEEGGNDDVGTNTNVRNNAAENFPVKLHYMLGELRRDGLEHIVSWQPHGRCFIVHNQKEFEQKILPYWFRQTKLASFQRQLNIYGFQRLTTGRDKNGYFHELFLRGKQLLARKIQRNKIKGQGPRKPSSPDSEPNFYLMPPLPDIAATPVQEASFSDIARSQKNTPVITDQEISEKIKPGGGTHSIDSITSLGSILAQNNYSCPLHQLLPEFGSVVRNPIGLGGFPQVMPSYLSFGRTLGASTPTLDAQHSISSLSSNRITSAIDRALLIAQADTFTTFPQSSLGSTQRNMTGSATPSMFDSMGLLSGLSTELSDYILSIQNR